MGGRQFLSTDVVLIRSRVTATNTTPGRAQKFRIHLPTNLTPDSVDYTLTFAKGAASPFDFGSKDVQTLHFELVPDSDIINFRDVTI